MRIIISIILSLFFCSQSFYLRAQEVHVGIKQEELISIKGQPYYQTEHYSNRPGEQVWLYTKKETQKQVDEKQIVDDKTGWLTLYRKTVVRTCEVGDIFVQISQGVVKSIIPAKVNTTYGPCSIETTEEFLPIVNGVPAKVPTRSTTNTTVEEVKSKH